MFCSVVSPNLVLGFPSMLAVYVCKAKGFEILHHETLWSSTNRPFSGHRRASDNKVNFLFCFEC